MPEFRTTIAVHRFGSELKPCVDAWDLYIDLGIGDGTDPDDQSGEVFYLALPAARKLIRNSVSPRRQALLRHIDQLERAHNGAKLN
jgi:hypothetical protein